jgi:hypothetical protein
MKWQRRSLATWRPAKVPGLILAFGAAEQGSQNAADAAAYLLAAKSHAIILHGRPAPLPDRRCVL